MISALTAYLGLFISAFLAATLLPAQSEIGLAALILSGHYSVMTLVIIASIGNSLGAVVTWAMGLFLQRFQSKSWFPIPQHLMAKTARWYQHYGKWSLLVSWVPVIGDPLCCMAGICRLGFWPFLMIVGFAKTMRYIVIALLATGIAS